MHPETKNIVKGIKQQLLKKNEIIKTIYKNLLGSAVVVAAVPSKSHVPPTLCIF